MPPRISRSSLPGQSSRPQQRANKKQKGRGLNALSIASQENERVKSTYNRRHGVVEDEGPRRKRQRVSHDEENKGGDEEEVTSGRTHRINSNRRQLEDADYSEGSDSEGHEWKMGDVRDVEDSDIDSDEAFGESEEELFEGFTFRGSSSNKTAKSFKAREGPHDAGINLDEDEGLNGGEEEDDFGEDGVDLAQMLDDSNESEGSGSASSDGSDGGAGERDEDSGSEQDDSDLESDTDPVARAQMLQDIVSSIPQDQDDKGDNQVRSTAPTAQSLLKSLQAMSNLDPSLGQSVKTLSRDLAKANGGRTSNRVAVPLPKRQQDRLDRAAAYEKAKETLNRWVETVKHNRRAEHLSFPLPEPDAHEPRGASRMIPVDRKMPRTDLESAIQGILKDSGMADSVDDSHEKEVLAAEELETKNVPLEEVMVRRAELRRQRDLLFREERRAKRVNKIKSKAYRRVHRREKEKEAQKERDLMVAAGIDIPEEEQEAMDRRRAEERMGARHRESRWAKSVKQSGRGAWDLETRSDMASMARNREELTQRIAGEATKHSEDDDDSDTDSNSSDDENGFRLRDSLPDPDVISEPQTLSRLGSMKFMQRAEAAKRKQNEEAFKQLTKDIDGQQTESESEAEAPPGRQIFQPVAKENVKGKQRMPRLEFEEASDSDIDNTKADQTLEINKINSNLHGSNGVLDTKTQDSQPVHKREGIIPCKSQAQPKSMTGDDRAVASSQTSLAPSTPGSAVAGGLPVSANQHPRDKTQPTGNDDSDEENPAALLPSNLELVQAAFGTDDAEDEFATEKRNLVEDEDEKVVENTLPGWGSWAGAGLSKREKKVAASKRQSGRFAVKQQGINPNDRQDAKLGNRVIVSEKFVKKNQKYLASALPHPFESRQQYERSLRVPIGPEWTTKESFQSATKPRILIKQGIIKPMQQPMA